MIKLGSICEFINGGAWSDKEYVPQGIPVLKVSNCKSSGFSIDDVDYLPMSAAEKYARNKLQKNDVIIATVGSHPNLKDSAAGRSCIVNSLAEGYYLNQNAVCIRTLNETVLSQRYLGYLTKYYPFQHFIQMRGRGAANQMRIAISSIKEYTFDLPNIDTQCQIADILSSYDNLIENNQKQIKLLEEAAQRLYKEWFVDLRFPGYEATQVVNGVPDGWISTTLERICTLNKKTIKPANIPSDIPYIGLEHIPRRDICLCEWGNSSDISSNKILYQERDIIFGKIRPYFHKVGFALNCGVASTDSIIMRAKKGVWGLLLMTVSSVPFVNYTSQTCKEGSKMPRADWNQMKEYPILIASQEIQETFESSIGLIADRIKTLAMQNRGLAEARDRLLPKLMSGEVEV